MPTRILLVFGALAFAFALFLACGEAEGPAGVDAAPPALPLTGTYQVTGTTIDRATGAERSLSGTIVVKAEGDRYTSNFSLNTTLHGTGEPQKAELIGHGEGSVEGRDLVGTAETQMIVALVPGVPVIRLLIGVQVVNGLVLPILLVLITRIAGNREVMGRYANGRFLRAAAWAITGVMALLALLMVATTLLQAVGVV